tara:strand:- start:45 stop:1046 length:1002 start_codon:yes stop_codon:yes gene_type:complete
MARLRMNDEYRTKILNRYIEHAESEDTQERQAYLDTKAKVHDIYESTFELAKEVVSRSYPQEDVDTCKSLKEKYGQPLDVVAKDKCFYFSYANDDPDQEEDAEISAHFDFGLYGSCNDSNYDNTESGKRFAYAYYRDELKAKDCNPDIYPQQEKNEANNPHKNANIEKNDKALGYTNYNRYNSSNDNNVGISQGFDEQFYLDIIGTSHCRSRTIACTQQEFQTFNMFKKQKAQLYMAHATWIDTIEAQRTAIKTGLKAYRFLTEGVELMTELGVDCDEADLIKVNSTGLTMYNPVNLASMIEGMKNKTQTREQKIAERLKYDTVVVSTSSMQH